MILYKLKLNTKLVLYPSLCVSRDVILGKSNVFLPPNNCTTKPWEVGLLMKLLESAKAGFKEYTCTDVLVSHAGLLWCTVGASTIHGGQSGYRYAPSTQPIKRSCFVGLCVGAFKSCSTVLDTRRAMKAWLVGRRGHQKWERVELQARKSSRNDNRPDLCKALAQSQ
jgi:hypothetical protein